MNLAIITARGGSKRIPRKNIKTFHGKPIIAYAIESALQTKLFGTVMVSTDDQEIVDIAIKYGASVPFLRSPSTSNDHATTAEVIAEVLHEYQSMDKNFDFACCIYPTAVFANVEDLVNSFQKIKTNLAIKTVVPVVKYSYPIQRALGMQENKLQLLHPEHALTRSQDLTPSYHDVGQFYWLRVVEFLKEPKLFTDTTIGYEVPEWRVQDIDTESDWILAEIKYELLTRNKLLGEHNDI